MDHNGTPRPTTTSLPVGISGELRDWYALGVGANKFVYGGKVYGSKDPRFPDGHKMYTGYILGIILAKDYTIVQDTEDKQWICYTIHQQG